MIGNTHLELKLNKATNKVNDLQKSLTMKSIHFTPQSNVTSNITKYNLSDSFHGQSSLKKIIFSVLTSGEIFY